MAAAFVFAVAPQGKIRLVRERGKEFQEPRARYGRQAHEDPGVVAVVVREEEGIGGRREQVRAVERAAAEDDRLPVLFQTDEQLAADLQGGRAVRRAFLGPGERQRDPPDGLAEREVDLLEQEPEPIPSQITSSLYRARTLSGRGAELQSDQARFRA